MAKTDNKVFTLGPFIGGINNISEISNIADNEMIDCQNFNIDIDGTLFSRSPITPVSIGAIASFDPHTITVIGTAIDDNGTDPLVIFSVYYGSGSASNFVAMKNMSTGTVTTLRTGITSLVALQYQNKIFVVATAPSSVGGGYWDLATNAWTNDANMPRGYGAVFYKQRMWITPGRTQTDPARYQLRFTDPISISAPTPLVWTASNLIPVGQGDGFALNDIAVHNDYLLLLKQGSTWIFAYDDDPANGTLRQINTEIGVADAFCVVQHENSTFVLDNGKVYELINYSFTDLNIRFALRPTETQISPSNNALGYAGLSVIGDLIVARLGDGWYVYHIKVKAWTRWTSESVPITGCFRFVEVPYDVSAYSYRTKEYISGSLITKSGATDFTLYSYKDTTDSTFTTPDKDDTGTEFAIDCFIRSKVYTFENDIEYKKLMWWGVDSYTAAPSESRAIIFDRAPLAATWQDLSSFTWGQLQSWDSPAGGTNLIIATTYDSDGTLQRRLIKNLKTLRFKRVVFDYVTQSNANNLPQSVQVYSMAAVVGMKATVEKAMN